MTDYKEEQNNEIEALESIYPDEFESKYWVVAVVSSCYILSPQHLVDPFLL